jgi:hypothetical protein
MITANLAKRWTPKFVSVFIVHVVLLLTFMVLNMITYKFYVGKDVYEFTAESKLNAMEMCNRQVIDKLDLHPMAWADAGQNAFSYQSGNFFD